MSDITDTFFVNKSKSCSELSFSAQFHKKYLQEGNFIELLEEKNKALCAMDELNDEVTDKDSSFESECDVIIVSNRSNSSYYDPKIRKIIKRYL